VDLRTLSKLQLAPIKRQLTGNILKACIQKYIDDREDIKELKKKILKSPDTTGIFEVKRRYCRAFLKLYLNLPPCTWIFFSKMMLHHVNVSCTGKPDEAETEALKAAMTTGPSMLPEVGFLFAILTLDLMMSNTALYNEKRGKNVGDFWTHFRKENDAQKRCYDSYP
jgi:hypothetical protein